MDSLAILLPKLNILWSPFISFLHHLTISFQYADQLRDVDLYKVWFLFYSVQYIFRAGKHYLLCYTNIQHVYNFEFFEKAENRKIKVNSYVPPTFLPYVILRECLGLIKFDNLYIRRRYLNVYQEKIQTRYGSGNSSNSGVRILSLPQYPLLSINN